MKEGLLLEKAKGGDRKAFSALLEGHLSMIYSIAYRMCGNSEDASDMTQEVMIKLFKNIGSFNGQSKLSTWIYRVATNTCIDELKKMKRHKTLSIHEKSETDDGEIEHDIEDTAPTPETLAERKEIRDIVASAILNLSEEHRAVIVLRDIKGLSYQEVAEITGQSEGTVKSRLSRGRMKLKEVLKNQYNIDGTYFEE